MRLKASLSLLSSAFACQLASVHAAPPTIIIEKVEMEGSASGKRASAAPAQGTQGRPATTAPTAARPVAGAGPIQMNQSKVLHIWIRNRTRNEQPETTIRYWVCGRDMKTNKAVVLDGGEQLWKPGPSGSKESTKEILTEPISSSYQMKSNYTPVMVGGMAGGMAGMRPGMAGARPGMPMMQPGLAGGMPAASAAPQTSSGVKIIGHAVQIIQFDKIIEESYIEPSLKELVGSSGTKPGPAFVKKEAAEK
jgi:hypothetical protein